MGAYLSLREKCENTRYGWGLMAGTQASKRLMLEGQQLKVTLATGWVQRCGGLHTCLNAPPLHKEKGKNQGKEWSPLTISEHSLPNSSKKCSVVISPFKNLIQGPLSPPLIRAFTIVPEGT